MTNPAPWAPAAALSGASYSAVELSADGRRVFMLEQRALPERVTYVELTDVAGVAHGITAMIVRGAPAIGLAAAYGLALAARSLEQADAAAYAAGMREAGALLCASRPTAVNLAWAVAEVLGRVPDHAGLPGALRADEVADQARALHRADVESCRAIGRAALPLFPREGKILTHCNAGALATGGYGTALGVVRALREAGRPVSVLACETRPYLQGARLTAWELAADGIAVEVITDSMAAHFMKAGEIGGVVVGADRIARSGDVANKIGTYALACLADVHRIPFFVAAPWSTVDLATPDGAGIPIEERSSDEVAEIGGRRILPVGVRARHPAFDVTPARLVTAILTERGAIAPSELERFA